MDLVALFSGGKDSTLSILKALEAKHKIKYLATIHSENPDSYMYHTSNIGLTVIQAEAMGIQLVSKESKGIKEKEVEDLKILLDGLNVEGVVCGAVASNYQKRRIEKVCKELNLKLLSPLWGSEQKKLLREILEKKFEVIITAVSADGFDESWLGRRIDEKCVEDLIKLNEKFGINITFEGGEAETTVLDCPIFKKKIKVLKSKKVWDPKTKSGKLIIEEAILVDKHKKD